MVELEGSDVGIAYMTVLVLNFSSSELGLHGTPVQLILATAPVGLKLP